MSFNIDYNPPPGGGKDSETAAAAAPPPNTHTVNFNSRFDRRPQVNYARMQTYQPYVFKPNFLKNQAIHDEAGNLIQPAKKFGRKVIDWTSPSMRYIHRRRFMQFPTLSRPAYINSGGDSGNAIPSDERYSMQLMPSMATKHTPANSVTTRFARTATNKRKCQIHKITWTPDGRRLITGASTGEFTIWNSMGMNFETITQAHESCIRSMGWANNEQWLLSGDHNGYVKYWQTNLNNVHMFQAHKDYAVRAISFSPTDRKFATASDDATVRIWDFLDTKTEEHTMREHGSDVKDVKWHPQKSLLASGSKDLQTPIVLWCPKSGKRVSTLHCHKGTVMELQWNRNGKHLLSASRDHMIKLFDIRNLKKEMFAYRGHRQEASCLAWHPHHEGMFVSGGADGAIFFWKVGEENEIASIEPAHSSIIWSLAWHPVGHLLASGSNDNTARFWARNRPGDTLDLTGCNRDSMEYDHVQIDHNQQETAGESSNLVEKFQTSDVIPGIHGSGATDVAPPPVAGTQLGHFQPRGGHHGGNSPGHQRRGGFGGHRGNHRGRGGGGGHHQDRQPFSQFPPNKRFKHEFGREEW